MTSFRTSRTFDVIFIVAMAGLIWLAYINRVAIGDTVYFWGYTPDPRAIQAADAGGLSPAGRRLFYRTNPQFASKAAVEAECDIERLGCLNEKGQTFILDEPRKPGQTVVTAAHEMLHLAYRRLSDDARAGLAPLLDEAIKDHSLDINIELEGLTSPEDRRDEAHSLLGSEYKELPAGLEEYYKAYFTDRSKVVAAQAEEN